MSRSKPNTLLSFVCNATGVPGYRTEMHMDMRRSFERFQVDNGVAQGACFELERAAYDLRLSTSDPAMVVPINGGLYAAGRARAEEASPVLFKEVADEIVGMVVNATNFDGLSAEIDPNGVPGTAISGFGPITIGADGVVAVAQNPRRDILLEYLYYFFHFKEARAAIMRDMSGVARAADKIDLFFQIPRDSAGNPQVLGALQKLGALMDAPVRTGVTDAAVRPLALEVCGLLALEYAQIDIPICW